jgi:hypothetical protein
VDILMFLYGFFLIVAFRYGRGLTGKNYLFWVGIALGLSLMLLSPTLGMNLSFGWWTCMSIVSLLSVYQAYYWLRYRFFPAKVGWVINTFIMVGMLGAFPAGLN